MSRFTPAKTAFDSAVAIQGRTESIGQIWDSFMGGQSAADFIAQDDRPVAAQCRAYAEWAAENMADDSDDAPEWADADTDALADSLERYIDAATN